MKPLNFLKSHFNSIFGRTILSRNNKTPATFAIDLNKNSSLRSISPAFTMKKMEPVILIDRFIDKVDINDIQVLCDFVKQKYPSQFENRSFEKMRVNYDGDEVIIDESVSYEKENGNSVLFIEGYMQEHLPSLLEHIMKIISEAAIFGKWHPYPRHLGIRCIESLLYSSSGQLSFHTDSGSIFTIVIMLSDPSASGGDFTGGDFIIQHGGCSIRIPLKQGEAVMFDSNALHGVDVITGKRKVLVLELWPFEDSGILKKESIKTTTIFINIFNHS